MVLILAFNNVKMGGNISKSENEVFDTISQSDVKVVGIVGPEAGGKTYIYEILSKMTISPHYISTKIYCDTNTIINGQMFQIFDCPSDCIIDADVYILVLGIKSDAKYLESMRVLLDSNDIVVVSRFPHHINNPAMEDIIDVRYDPYTELSIVL